ncbi:MAG: hypothetical protein WAT19_06765 [Ferruginibacter sp.]
MPLSWNEIKARAASFAKEWKGTEREEADAEPFLDAFFDAKKRIRTSCNIIAGKSLFC